MTRDTAKLYDVRTLERNLRKGLINKKDYEKYLKALPDREANAAISKPDESKDIEYPVEDHGAAEPIVVATIDGEPVEPEPEPEPEDDDDDLADATEADDADE